MSLTPTIATFDERDHCVTDGWATYQNKPMRRFRLRCAFDRHAWPLRKPYPPDGNAPANFDRCTRCLAAVHWFVDGQHRHGSLSRYFDNLTFGAIEGAT